jgi:hypothetical protein
MEPENENSEMMQFWAIVGMNYQVLICYMNISYAARHEDKSALGFKYVYSLCSMNISFV